MLLPLPLPRAISVNSGGMAGTSPVLLVSDTNKNVDMTFVTISTERSFSAAPLLPYFTPLNAARIADPSLALLLNM